MRDELDFGRVQNFKSLLNPILIWFATIKSIQPNDQNQPTQI